MALELSYSQSGAVALNAVLMSQDANKYRSFVLQVMSIGAGGALKVQQSNDNSTWVDGTVLSYSTGTFSSTVSTAGLYSVNMHARYVRVIVGTAITSGTTSVLARCLLYPQSDAIRGLPPAPTNSSVIGGTFGTMVATASQGPVFSVAQLAAAAASTNATLVKASVGRVAKIRGYNAAASVRYLKLYNKATAPVPGTDTPFMQIPLKAADAFDFDIASLGLSFSTGIGYALTTGPALNDATAVTANDIVGLTVLYI